LNIFSLLARQRLCGCHAIRTIAHLYSHSGAVIATPDVNVRAFAAKPDGAWRWRRRDRAQARRQGWV